MVAKSFFGDEVEEYRDDYPYGIWTCKIIVYTPMFDVDLDLYDGKWDASFWSHNDEELNWEADTVQALCEAITVTMTERFAKSILRQGGKASPGT